ncbi:MAG: radical SAM protein [Desulfohalobiaceae bacterium]|nr:radical SAM protein [Desulfohalobiaceae bacterium]
MSQPEPLLNMIRSMASRAGTLLTQNAKVRSLFLKRAEQAAHTYILKENSDQRPVSVQKEKLQIMLNLAETASLRIEEGLYAKSVLNQAMNILFRHLLFSPTDANKKIVETFQARFGRRPPGFLVIGPTNRCNLQCKGCYAPKAPETIPFAVLDRILQEKKELWASYFLTWVGGEPMMYSSEGYDILDIAERHQDTLFLMYTNGTLITRDKARRMADLGNLVPQVSVEGFEKETDQRRGSGVFKKILEAFENMRKEGVPFGIAMTPMRHNMDLLISDEFLDFYFNRHKATMAWVFQYMPIGRDYDLNLMITPEQRLRLLDREREILWKKRLFYVDFWNSGPIGSGCIAAGRPDGYFYIDGKGWVMPCPYYQFSPVNIFDVYAKGGDLNDIYNQPFFESLRCWQEEYGYAKTYDATGNWLRPCPIRDHHRLAMEAVQKHAVVPEDEATAKWFQDLALHQALYDFDERLKQLMDPYWEKIYLKEEGFPEDPGLPFTASGPPEISMRF